MTIASEIARLQTDKECIRQAIENKGVTVSAALTFDDYAACIDAIPSGGGYAIFDYIVVGGGAGGGWVGGGGGGEVVLGNCFMEAGCVQITVGCGGTRAPNYNTTSTGGTDTCFGDVVAKGGCGTPGPYGRNGGTSGSGCTGGSYCSTYSTGGGGGGAGGNGTNATNGAGGNGGAGICGYGGGGGGNNRNGQGGCACDGGGGAAQSGQCYGGAGGGAYNPGSAGDGYQGGVIVSHPEGCTYKISGETCKYTCNGCCIYEFASDGYLIVS